MAPVDFFRLFRILSQYFKELFPVVSGLVENRRFRPAFPAFLSSFFPFLPNRVAKVTRIFLSARKKFELFLSLSSGSGHQLFTPTPQASLPLFKLSLAPFASIGSANVPLFYSPTIPQHKKITTFS